jgi:hypothetical protein
MLMLAALMLAQMDGVKTVDASTPEAVQVALAKAPVPRWAARPPCTSSDRRATRKSETAGTGSRA